MAVAVAVAGACADGGWRGCMEPDVWRAWRMRAMVVRSSAGSTTTDAPARTSEMLDADADLDPGPLDMLRAAGAMVRGPPRWRRAEAHAHRSMAGAGVPMNEPRCCGRAWGCACCLLRCGTEPCRSLDASALPSVACQQCDDYSMVQSLGPWEVIVVQVSRF